MSKLSTPLISMCAAVMLVLVACGSGEPAKTASSTTQPAAPGVSNRVLIMLTKGPPPSDQTMYTETDLWHINLALSLANRSLTAGRPTTLFLDVHAPVLARQDLSPTLRFLNEPPIKAQLAKFVADRGIVMICPLCAQTMGVQPADVIPGVRYGDEGIFGPDGLAPGATSLSF